MSVLDQLPPEFSPDEIRSLVRELYGLEGSISALDSERDQNTRLIEANGQAWVLKVANIAEDQQGLDFQAALLSHAFDTDPHLVLPRVRKTRTGELLGRGQASDGRTHFVRAVSWLDGKPFALGKKSERHFESLGETLGRLSVALQGFVHAGAIREFDWDLTQAGRSRSRLHFIDDPVRREILTHFLEEASFEPAIRIEGSRSNQLHFVRESRI